MECPGFALGDGHGRVENSRDIAWRKALLTVVQFGLELFAVVGIRNEMFLACREKKSEKKNEGKRVSHNELCIN